MLRIKQLVSVAAVSGLLVFTGHARAGTVTGANGVSLSVYANPFDPNEDFNASETTASFGDPVTGLAGGWFINTDDGQLTHAVDRRDGRVFFGNTSSFIDNSATNGPAAFIQLTAPSTFRVGTVITSHDTDFSSYLTPQPFTLQFNNGASIGKTNADWAAVTPLTSGAGAVGDNSIVVTQGFAPFTADTVRVAFSSTSNSGNNNSQASIQEIVALPDSLMQLHTSVTPVTGYSSDGSGLSGAGLIDGQGGANSGSTPSGIWDDFSGAAVTSKFFTINVLDPLPINAMVLYGDDASAGEEFDIFDDTNLIGHVTFDAAAAEAGEVLPIRFDTPVYTTSLRFQMTSSPSGNASMREVVLLTDTPEPASGALLATAGMLLLRRRRGALAMQ